MEICSQKADRQNSGGKNQKQDETSFENRSMTRIGPEIPKLFSQHHPPELLRLRWPGDLCVSTIPLWPETFRRRQPKAEEDSGDG